MEILSPIVNLVKDKANNNMTKYIFLLKQGQFKMIYSNETSSL